LPPTGSPATRRFCWQWHLCASKSPPSRGKTGPPLATLRRIEPRCPKPMR
jgi:hypothetical protein